MQTLTPSVQEPSGGLQAVEETPTDLGPLLTAPDTVLWLGFGFTILVFFLGMIAITRARVIKPARQKHIEQNKTFFEPAGKDAEITFDDDEDDTPPPAKKRWFGRGEKKAGKKKNIEPFQPPALQDDEDDEAEIVIERRGENVDAPDAHANMEDEPAFIAEPSAEPSIVKQNRSPFAALFSKKKKQREEPVEDALAFSEPEPDELASGPAPGPVEDEATVIIEKAPAPLRPEAAPVDDDADNRRRAEEEAFAARHQAEADAAVARHDAEQRLRAEELAHAAASRDSVVGIQKHEAQLEQRFSELSRQLHARLDASPQAARDPDALEEYIVQQFGDMRAALQHSIEALNARVDTFDASPEGIGMLSKQIASLNQLLSENTTGATASKVQLSDLIRGALPPNAYAFQKKLANNKTADCVIELPHPPGEMAIDAQFPVEVFDAYVLARKTIGGEEKAENDFRRAVLRHIVGVSEKLIIPGKTAASALMFVPSETIYAELHARFPDLVQDSYNAHVWMVSPTSLMATLHTIREIMRDAPGSARASHMTSEASEEIAALRERVLVLEQMIGDENQYTKPTLDQGEASFADPAADPAIASMMPAFREKPVSAVLFDANTGADSFSNERSLAREEEAFERLEREETLREATDAAGPGATRTPFPLR